MALTACTYRLGSPDRSLPGGYRQVYVPIFKNLSQETGIEVDFTNSLIQEFERAKIGRVTDSNQAEVVAEGLIESVTYAASGLNSTAQITGAVLATQYQILITARVTLRRQSDKSVLWSGTFNGEKAYYSPQIIAAGINTANPLYNLSARRQNIQIMASEMMTEAHDRITENF